MQSVVDVFSTFPRIIARMSTTRANDRIGMAADVTTAAALIGFGLSRDHEGVIATTATLVAGLLFFSFIEYAFHRWLFHGPHGPMQRGHWQHHVDPLGHDSLPFFVAPVLMLSATALLALVVPTTIAMLLAGAIASGYSIYGLTHLLIHRHRFTYPLARRWAASHHIHHAHPDRNFGVTTPLWDILLRTRHVSKRRLIAS